MGYGETQHQGGKITHDEKHLGLYLSSDLITVTDKKLNGLAGSGNMLVRERK